MSSGVKHFVLLKTIGPTYWLTQMHGTVAVPDVSTATSKSHEKSPGIHHPGSPSSWPGAAYLTFGRANPTWVSVRVLSSTL